LAGRRRATAAAAVLPDRFTLNVVERGPWRGGAIARTSGTACHGAFMIGVVYSVFEGEEVVCDDS